MTDTEVTANTGEAVFVFRSLALKRGGVTRAMLARAQMYAHAGIPVRLLLTGHGGREEHVERELRKKWDLSTDRVQFRYFWRDAAPGGGGAPVDQEADEKDMTVFAEKASSGNTVVRCYADGLLAKTKHYDDRGTLVWVDRHDNARRIVAKEVYDEHSKLVRIDELSPDDGTALLRRWFDSSGACWLTNWLTPAGSATKAVRHHPQPQAYDTFGQVVASWVDDVLADATNPVVFVDQRHQDTVLLNMKHPTARKVSILHNCHTVRPHRVTDATKRSWLPLLKNIDALDAVVALTHRQRDDIVARYGGDNFVVINHPTPPHPEVDVERKPGLLIAITRLDQQKRLSHAIRAFAIAAKKVPEARFHIYGRGEEGPMLRKLVRELDVEDKVLFKGFTDRPLEVFASATATVLSSWFEGFPLVLNEAMGVGTPFVTYDVNYGPSEVITDGVDGLLVPVGDIDALANGMVRLLSDPEFAAELGKRAREVDQRYSLERWRSEWLDLHQRLAGERR